MIDTMADKVLTCADCGMEFVFTASEQQFYADHEFSEPRRCAPCRAARKAQNELTLVEKKKNAVRDAVAQYKAKYHGTGASHQQLDNISPDSSHTELEAFVRATVEARGIRVVERDLLAEGPLVRHDPAKLSQAILDLAGEGIAELETMAEEFQKKYEAFRTELGKKFDARPEIARKQARFISM